MMTPGGIVSHKIVALITSLIVVGAARPATPQVAKPTALPGGAEPTARLPAPQKMTAQQRTDGRILVAWSPVEGAVQYRLTRSVPPGGILPVSLPDPSDTQYVDQDVRPGSTYYYAVAAVDQGGSVGLKIGSQPVTATDLTPVPAAPTGVRAELRGSTASISWNFVPGIRYQIERASFSGANPSSWLPLPAPSTCCLLDNLAGVAAGSHVLYRVRAQGSSGVPSPPSLSNEIVIGTTTPSDSTAGNTGGGALPAGGDTRVRPAVVGQPSTLKVGDPDLPLGSSPSFTSLGLQSPHWLSLDGSIATVDYRGRVRARASGVTYIVALGMSGDGSVASMVTRIDVRSR
jgi:hypothetical protein